MYDKFFLIKYYLLIFTIRKQCQLKFIKAVRLIEIFILQSPLIFVRCPSYRGVRFIESFSVVNPTIKTVGTKPSVRLREVSLL